LPNLRRPFTWQKGRQAPRFKESRFMGQFSPNADQFPLEDQIKNLGDDELLDFWEETQYLERMLVEEESSEPDHSVEYERVILQELMLRSCRRTLEGSR
jgi:hypothetical protein